MNGKVQMHKNGPSTNFVWLVKKGQWFKTQVIKK